MAIVFIGNRIGQSVDIKSDGRVFVNNRQVFGEEAARIRREVNHELAEAEKDIGKANRDMNRAARQFSKVTEGRITLVQSADTIVNFIGSVNMQITGGQTKMPVKSRRNRGQRPK